MIVRTMVFFLSLVLCLHEGVAMGSKEVSRNLGRLSTAADEDLIFDNKAGSYRLDLTTGKISFLSNIYSLNYSADSRYTIGCFVSEKDRARILGRNSRTVANPKSYSGIVVFKDGTEVSRFETDGFCSDPFLDTSNLKIYYRKSMNKKERFDSPQTVDFQAGNEIFESGLDGSGEKRLTFLSTTIVEITFSQQRGELAFAALDRANGTFSVKVLSLSSGLVSGPNEALAGFNQGDLCLAFARDSGNLFVLRRDGKSPGLVPHVILRRNSDSKYEALGRFAYNVLGRPESVLRSLAVLEKRGQLFFLLESPLSDTGEASYRKMYTVNFDGSQLAAVDLDLEKLTTAIRAIPAGDYTPVK